MAPQVRNWAAHRAMGAVTASCHGAGLWEPSGCELCSQRGWDGPWGLPGLQPQAGDFPHASCPAGSSRHCCPGAVPRRKTSLEPALNPLRNLICPAQCPPCAATSVSCSMPSPLAGHSLGAGSVSVCVLSPSPTGWPWWWLFLPPALLRGTRGPNFPREPQSCLWTRARGFAHPIP